MRFFGGLVWKTRGVLGVRLRRPREWNKAKAWLYRELSAPKEMQAEGGRIDGSSTRPGIEPAGAFFSRHPCG